MDRSQAPCARRILQILLIGVLAAAPCRAAAVDFHQLIAVFAAIGDRSTGTPGNARAAGFIKETLTQLEIGAVESHSFAVPVIRHTASSLTVPERGLTMPILPLAGNAITPQAIAPPGITGPLVYAGDGTLARLNGKGVEGAVLLMELDSAKNWLQAANLGASALIYVDRGDSARMDFEEKFELSPVQFPRFWMPVEALREAFGDFESAPEGMVAGAVQLASQAGWENAISENITCLIPGTSPELKKELLLVEAFYDSTAHVAGKSPGADEAVGAATLLQVARHLKEHPPERSVLLVATSGHAQSLAGLRELVWSFTARSRDLRDARNELQRYVKKARLTLQALRGATFDDRPAAGTAAPAAAAEEAGGESPEALLKAAIEERLKTDGDIVSRRLMQLRLDAHGRDPVLIRELTAERQMLRRLMWRVSFQELAVDERRVLKQVAAQALADQEVMLADARVQLRLVESAAALRRSVQDYEVAATVSLHLSSHGDGFGAFNAGWLYPLRPRINRVPAYSQLEEVLKAAAAGVERGLSAGGMYKDTLRPSRMRPWQSYFLDRPALGGEVTALAGTHGLTFVTTADARAAWGTPGDLPGKVDTAFAARQSAVVCGLIGHLGRAPKLREEEAPRNGFSSVAGRAKFLRHGELFADKPAPGTVVLCYQGPSRFHVMVDAQGRFNLKGVADKTHSFHKVILEAYRFDEESGNAVWAIDKKLTGKDAYRVKMNRRFMETDLVMFAGTGTTLYNLLEPRTFRHLSKADVIDGRREAEPLHWFMSRLDTWTSAISTVFLERGTPLKLTLSDTPLRRKLVLINASEKNPIGAGYKVEEFPLLHRTEYRVARDMWALLGPRIANLEARGIFNERIRSLQQQGVADLQVAEAALQARQYDRFSEASASSWALAARVYDDVDRTQKDVLYGVLFYIALFVPFAFCLERLLFAYANIYKRIAAFSGILVLLIVLIYNVHPAFQLAYSPMVVILAFLIMGLSLVVTLIIFFRFEQEIASLQPRARSAQGGEIGRWKAFVAAFMLGVSNLRRRRLRTALTCTTLVILTFTIMSFTSVKSLRHHARILYDAHVPYYGFLLKNADWADLPSEALGVIASTFAGTGTVVPRAWLEGPDRARTTFVPLRADGRVIEAQGMMGLSAAESRVSGLDAILEGGRWFTEADRFAVLLPNRMAANLGIDPRRPEGRTVSLWGMTFEVVGVFSAKKLQERQDLDGEPLTPVTFPREMSAEMTEEEVDALESGDDVREFQSRYQHTAADLTVIVPYQTLIAAGGRLKAVAIRTDSQEAVAATAQKLVDRFGLALFSGEPDGTFLYNASDAMSYSGVPNIIVPLAISVFIVLNTMIGSVYERKREIAVYTSVGLAPSHVSFLFIAEALAFAVLSVVFGYLLAQTSAKLFSETALWAGITVNYSSLAGVAAMMLVIMVVLVSVIYPSKVAGQIAIPDVNRSWTLPSARGNTLELVFPFLMTYREHVSVGGYLYDYFDGHTDVAQGLFSTSDIALGFACETATGLAGRSGDCPEAACEFSECLQLKSRVWLAPFDFGIMQVADLKFKPSPEQPGFLEIHVRLTRESGESNAWHRINKGFLHRIRRQLLVWRSLDDETKLFYERLLADVREQRGAVTDGAVAPAPDTTPGPPTRTRERTETR
ncbi:MAG TPA: FtsX-like permease family protein [Desulfobacterales bacterium]|nr:FtsX-like permease family protein [Desulfobacterales bacterium]